MSTARLSAIVTLAAMGLIASIGGCHGGAATPQSPEPILQTIQKLDSQAQTIADAEKRDEILGTIRLLQTQIQFGELKMPPVAKDLLVDRIQILPLTQVSDWDNDGTLDGFEVLVDALDHFGDKTKVVGKFYFELFPYRAGFADPRGIERVAFWEVPIETADESRRYWEEFSRNYHFNLKWTKMPDIGDKFVFQATYVAPWGKTIATEPRTLTRVE